MKRKENGFFTITWNAFTSVKLSVILLTLIAASSVIGTLIPQSKNLVLYKQTYTPAAYAIIEKFHLFDIFHSLWFQFLLLLLTINLIVCSLERFPSTLKIARKKMSRNPERFIKKKGTYTFKTKPFTCTEITKIKFELGKIAGTPVIEKKEKDFFLFAEKGRWTRLGVYIVHLSVILLLAGGLIGSMAGFEGSVNILEGEKTDIVNLKNSQDQIKLDFEIKCDDFDVLYYDNHAPKEYKSHLSIIKNGSTVLSKEIIVNDPLRYEGINIYQASYGSVPGEKVTINFTSKKTGMTYPETLAFKEEVKIPETTDKFMLSDYMESFEMKGRTLRNVFVGVILKSSGEKEMVVLPQALDWFDGMRRSKAEITISVAGVDKKYYTGLQITKDPGVKLVYAGFIFMILGCIVTFFMSHRQFCISIIDKKKNFTVSISGIANKNKYGMDMIVNKLGKKIENLLKG